MAQNLPGSCGLERRTERTVPDQTAPAAWQYCDLYDTRGGADGGLCVMKRRGGQGDTIPGAR